MKLVTGFRNSKLIALLLLASIGVFGLGAEHKKLFLDAGAGIEAGIAGLDICPAAELVYDPGIYGIGGRLGATIGTYQGQEIYLTGSARGYVGWVYAEFGGSYQLRGIADPPAGEAKFSATGLMPMGALGLAIPIGKFMLDAQLGVHMTDLVMSNDPIAVLFAGPAMWAISSVKLGVFGEYRFDL